MNWREYGRSVREELRYVAAALGLGIGATAFYIGTYWLMYGEFPAWR